MNADQTVPEKTELLNSFTMEYETAVIPFSAHHYLEEFFDFYEIKNRDLKPAVSPEPFSEAMKELSGYDVWQPIAEKTESLFGTPERITVFEDSSALKEELEGPDGLAPFFFVFDIMFCEYKDCTLCFISGSNN